MKRLLLSLAICLTSIITIAQTTFNGNGDGTSWFDAGNWDTNMIPSITSNVIIPTGFSVNQNGSSISVNSITLQGTSTLNANTQITTTGTSTLGPNTIANVASNSFVGSGTINAQGTINITTTTAFSGTQTINNSGIILITGGTLQINTGILNNLVSGVIEIQTDGGNITSSNGGVLYNEGLIKKINSGSANLQCSLNNNNGTIQVENGALVIGSSPGGSLINGTYNIFAQATLDLALTFTLDGTLQGTIDGSFNFGTTILSSTFNVSPGNEAIFDFSGDGAINFINPTFQGGGTITNKTVLNFIEVSPKRIIENTTFNNENTINILSSGDLIINDGTFNNLPDSIIDMQADMGNITWTNGVTHILNNDGIIKKTNSTGQARIQIDLNNNDGEISVESGILTFLGANEKNLVNGTYNVDSNATFNWSSDVNLEGNITGVIDGTLNWNNDVIVTSSVNLNFSGLGNFNWTNNNLTGGGNLINNSVLNLTGNGTKQILGNTSFENLNTVNITFSGDLNINDGFFLNFGGALLDLQGDSGNINGTQITTRPLVNSGIIRRSSTTGTAIIFAPTINSGTIEIVSGELEFFGTNVLENIESGYFTGIGTLDVPQLPDYINDGIMSPGLSPGILTIEGNYKSSASSYLVIELDGLIQGTEYDLLQIQGNASEGNAIFEGNVNVTLGFEPSLNDEFIIATTSGTIDTCNLASPVTATFNGNTYTFDVICRNNNEVVLTVIDPLSITEFENTNVNVYPNPTNDVLYIDSKENTIESIELISLTGQIVFKQPLDGNSISLENVSKGIYFIKFFGKHSIFTKKIIKL